MTNMELFKQNLEAYKAAETLYEQNKLIKELQNICSCFQPVMLFLEQLFFPCRNQCA